MKICQNCGAAVEENSLFCTNCGAKIALEDTPAQEAPAFDRQQEARRSEGASYSSAWQDPSGMGQVPIYNSYDRTAMFDGRDISDNKLFAVLPYLLGVIGLIFAMVAAPKSAYVRFHVKQALKLLIIQNFTVIFSALLFFTILAPLAGGVMMLIIMVSYLVAAIQVCSGKAIVPVVCRNFTSLDS